MYCPLRLALPYAPRHPADTFSVTEDSFASLAGNMRMGLVEPQQGTEAAMPGMTSASSLVSPKNSRKKMGTKTEGTAKPQAG